MVVFTDKDDRQIPERSDVESLKNLPLIGCTIPIPAHNPDLHLPVTVLPFSPPIQQPIEIK